jgi:hypothetical protein
LCCFCVVVFNHFNEEPRKVAHQIITIREGIGKELLTDFKSIPGENAEVIRYASQWMTEGARPDEKNRRLTRMANEGGATPLREKNYLDFTVLIINLAFVLVKAELSASNSPSSTASINYLDEFIANVSISDKSDPYERLEDERRAPRTLLEKLYYKSLTESMVVQGSATINLMKISKQILDKKIAIAYDFSRMIRDLASYSRDYYKMIKVNTNVYIKFFFLR